jgi:acetyl esterase/lipase
MRAGRRRPWIASVLVAAVIGVVVAPAGATTHEAPRCTETPQVVRGLRYDTVDGVDPNLLSLDLHLPATGESCPPVPLVVGVHGGGWRAGDKRGFTGDKASLFNGEGWAFANVNYRLSGPDVSPPVQYPTHDQDVANAIGFLVDHAKEYDLDPDRIGILGHSAGAGIIAAVATDEQFLEHAGLGLDTLRCAFPDDISFDVTEAIRIGGPYAAISRQAFGDDPAVWEQASPLKHVDTGKGIPPMLLTRRGGRWWQAQMDAFAAALRAADVEVEIIDAAGLTHADVNRLIGSTADPTMTEPVTTFFRECLEPDRR